MTTYKPRIADRLLQEKLCYIGSVLVEGPKACGKSTTAAHHARSIVYMDDPALMEQNIMYAQSNVHRLLQGDTPRLIDEWQIAPNLWDAVRFTVDQRGEAGQFILTGSAVPADLSQAHHTGTGRIARLRMRPMSLWESGDSTGDVSLASLFASSDVDGCCNHDLETMAYLVCRGGWPMAVNQSPNPMAVRHVQDYIKSVCESDVCRVDGVQRNPDRVARILRSLARNICQPTPISTIVSDISANEVSKLSEQTVASYITALKQIFVIEDMPAWNPNLRSKSAIRTSDTRHFVDPSVATAALALSPNDLICDLKSFGFFFEELCVRDLRVYADALGGSVYHFRDRNGLECDAVVHLPNGQYGLVEIKLGGNKLIHEGVQTLNSLAGKIDTDKMKAPAFKMILTAIGKYAVCREDGICIVPVGCLKD